MDEEIDQLAEDYPDTPDLSALNDWFYDYIDELEAESKKSIRRARYKKISSKAAIVLLALILSSAVVTFSVEAFTIKFFNLFIETSSNNDHMAFQVDEENYNLPESWDSYYFPSYLSKD